jgi:hypothetical protein
MAEKGTQFDTMLAQAKKLVVLMEQREFGCLTWHQMINEGMNELNIIYYEREFEEESPGVASHRLDMVGDPRQE